ncbi:ABC transporter ATP-binding protein [Dictyobacter formicarum]|uniref:Helicase n=1 Tax=Dictyobacter formicarum TaxID=2778368 RepID=A0ABQ3VI94_9CHLR|nr:ABC transporter ATP-binding protein [Dictyobacter formicarum]GHO85343.1 helicase [Dictyobacter formicarum]
MHIFRKRDLLLLTTYLKPQWKNVLLLAVSLLISIGLQLLNPQILRYFIDTAVYHGANASLIGAGLLFIGVALAKQGISIANTYLNTNVAWTATNQLRTDLVAHCLALDLDYHKTRTAGEMIERIDGDVNALTNFFSQFVLNLLTSLLLLLAILILFFTINTWEGLAMAVFSGAALLILMQLRRRAVPLWKEGRQAITTLYGFLSERLVGTEDIRANGAASYVLHRFYLLLRAWSPIFRKSTRAGAMMGIISLLLFVLGSVLSLSIGTALWMQGTISIGTVYLIFSYTDQLSQPIQQIQQQLQDLQQAEACIRRIEELRETQSALVDGTQEINASSALDVTFDTVTFGYVADEPVLQQLSFHLAAGRVLGIVGRTGSGKSTLSRLLFRLYDPQVGEIRLNDQPLPTLQLRSLRQHIGMVTQEVQLFHATVRDNLTLFNSAISDEKIKKALLEVDLANWLATLPDGLDTMLGTAGEGLSAGEAQLLAFARVFLTNPGIVVLDEASSRLDPATEHQIERAVDKLLNGRTALVIAHRLKTIQRVDDILLLEEGRIREWGPRMELEQDPDSHFSRLLHTAQEIDSAVTSQPESANEAH